MPDLLDRIRSEMSTRLAELRPLVAEHTRLSAALQALGDADNRTPVPAPAPPGARSTSRTAKTTSSTARKRAPRGANRLAVLRAVEDRPGATSAELATVSGISGGSLHALLARLVKSGELQKQTLPTGRTGYALRQGQPEASGGSAPAAGDGAWIAHAGPRAAALSGIPCLEYASAKAPQVDRRMIIGHEIVVAGASIRFGPVVRLAP